MAKVLLSKSTFDNLVKHLGNIEDGKNELVEQYFPQSTNERDDFERFLGDYIGTIDKLIKNASKSTKVAASLPFVIIGSEVTVKNLDNDRVHTFRLVLSSQGNKRGEVSCFSPVGKSLLLKRVSDQVTVKAPAGEFHYLIESIQVRDEDK